MWRRGICSLHNALGVHYAKFSTTTFLSNKTRIFFENDKHAIDIVINENYNDIYEHIKTRSDPLFNYYQKKYYELHTAHMSIIKENQLLRNNIKTLHEFIENKYT